MLRKVTSCTPPEEPLPLELFPPPPQATSSVLASPGTRTVRQGRPRPGLRADEDGGGPGIWRSPQAGRGGGPDVRGGPLRRSCGVRIGREPPPRASLGRSEGPVELWWCPAGRD